MLTSPEGYLWSNCSLYDTLWAIGMTNNCRGKGPVGFSFQCKTFLSHQRLMKKTFHIGNCVNNIIVPSLPTDVWLAPLSRNWLVKEITTASGHIVWMRRTGMTDFGKGWAKTLMWLMVLLFLMKLLSHISPGEPERGEEKSMHLEQRELSHANLVSW